MFENLKYWNWKLLIITVILSLVGSLSQVRSMDHLDDAIIIGLSIGFMIGLVYARLLMKKPNMNSKK